MQSLAAGHRRHEVVARQSGLWQERDCLPQRRSSSVVERTLGKGEAGSSILPCGTTTRFDTPASARAGEVTPMPGQTGSGENRSGWTRA